jgi:hypothetical protein
VTRPVAALGRWTGPAGWSIDGLRGVAGISPDPEMQIDPVALELDVVQLDLAVLVAALVAAGLQASSSASRRSHCRAASMSRTVIRREERTAQSRRPSPQKNGRRGPTSMRHRRDNGHRGPTSMRQHRENGYRGPDSVRQPAGCRLSESGPPQVSGVPPGQVW